MRLDMMRRMLDYGMKDRIVPGTDSGVGEIDFGHLDYDFQLLVRVGFTPAEALASATRISAEAIGLADEIGMIEPGKVADLVAFEGDPDGRYRGVQPGGCGVSGGPASQIIPSGRRSMGPRVGGCSLDDDEEQRRCGRGFGGREESNKEMLRIYRISLRLRSRLSLCLMMPTSTYTLMEIQI